MKNREQHDLEKLLRDNLSDKTAHVPDFVWDNIEEELFPKKRRRGFFWLFFFGIGLIGILSSLYLFSGNPVAASKQLAKETKQERGNQNENENEATLQSQRIEQKNENETGKGKESAVDSRSSETFSERKHTRERGNEQLNERGKAASSVSQKKSSSKNTWKRTTDRAKNGPESSSTDPMQKSQVRASSKQIHGKSRGQAGETYHPLADPVDPSTSLVAVESSPDNETAKHHKNELTEKNQPDQKDSTAAQTGSETEKEPEIAATGDTLENTVSIQDTAKPAEKETRFAVSVYGGTSLYDLAVFKDYFTSGQLSNRPFKSGGFEVGLGFSYNIHPKWGVYSHVSFNRKSTSFNYNLAITEADYFNHYSAGELIPIEHIEDDGANSCFLVKDVIADYQIDSWILSVGTTYQVLQWKKFTLGADLRFSANLNSSMQLNELTVIQVPSFEKERFNYFKLGGGLNLDYRINGHISLGIAPVFHWQFNPDKQSFYKGKLKELVLPLRVAFHF